jgi:hypothetical protein
MGLFKRKPKEVLPPEIAEIRKHQEALKTFIKDQSSIGQYGGGEGLHNTESAIRFFAYKNLDHLADGEDNDTDL